MSLFSAAPFLGPVLGPVVGGFVSITVGWRWVQGVCCILVGAVFVIGCALLPETYGPVVLRQIARRLSQKSSKVYISTFDLSNQSLKASTVFSKAAKRPWVLLFSEPIVLIAAIYVSNRCLNRLSIVATMDY